MIRPYEYSKASKTALSIYGLSRSLADRGLRLLRRSTQVAIPSKVFLLSGSSLPLKKGLNSSLMTEHALLKPDFSSASSLAKFKCKEESLQDVTEFQVFRAVRHNVCVGLENQSLEGGIDIDLERRSAIVKERFSCLQRIDHRRSCDALATDIKARKKMLYTYVDQSDCHLGERILRQRRNDIV